MNYVTSRFIALRTTDFINWIEKLLFNFDFPKFYHKNQHRMNACLLSEKLRYRFSRSTLSHVCKLKRVVQTSICTSANIVCMSTARPEKWFKVFNWRRYGDTCELYLRSIKSCAWMFLSRFNWNFIAFSLSGIFFGKLLFMFTKCNH